MMSNAASYPPSPHCFFSPLHMKGTNGSLFQRSVPLLTFPPLGGEDTRCFSPSNSHCFSWSAIRKAWKVCAGSKIIKFMRPCHVGKECCLLVMRHNPIDHGKGEKNKAGSENTPHIKVGKEDT
eukprot:698616-Pelagomonas_calceolata.AAC.1